MNFGVMPLAFRSASWLARASMTIPSASSLHAASFAPSLRKRFIAPW